jgi:hypothetical protein
MITVVCTTPKREMWLKDCLESIGDRPVIVLSDFSYEVGKLAFLLKYTKLDKFLLLQDSVVFKDADKFYELLAQYPNSVSVNYCPRYYGSYMGVYERRILEQVEIPVATCKKDQVVYECTFNDAYVAKAGGAVPVMYPELHDDNNTGFVEHYGRTNMVLENDVMIKYKGTWNWDNL